MTIALTNYSTTRTITITLASLASTTGLIAGRESTVVNSTTLNSVDYHVAGIITASSTGATAAKQVEIWSYGSGDGTNFSAGATGSDAAFTPTNTKSLLKLITIIPTGTTSSQAYNWGPVSIANTWGGVPPVEWGIFVVHNMGSALNAASTGNQAYYTPIQFTST